MCSFAVADENSNTQAWYHPSHIKLQYAGNIGYFSLGLGKQYLDNRLALEVFYGYARASKAGTKINTIALKNAYYWPANLSFIGPNNLNIYLGLNLFYALDVRETNAPGCLRDDDGYPCNSIHIMPYVGAEFINSSFTTKSNILPDGVYWEIGVLDLFLVDYYHNRSYLSLKDIVNMSVGFKWYVNR